MKTNKEYAVLASKIIKKFENKEIGFVDEEHIIFIKEMIKDF